jgi:cytochrome P450
MIRPIASAREWEFQDQRRSVLSHEPRSANGGHWYTTDSALTDQVLRDNIRFSSQTLLVPRENNPPLGRGFSPIHLDPPQHSICRKLMQMAFSIAIYVDGFYQVSQEDNGDA